jgi:type VI secretion system protein ImpA
MTGGPVADLGAGAGGDRMDFMHLDALLRPVPDGPPAGASLRYDPVYDRLREARRADDASTPQGIWQHDLKRANWAEVATLTSQALETRSKDLQLAAWLVEAWLHLHTFAGLRAGFTMLSDLCQAYWVDLFPLPDGGDQTARILIIEWVNDRLATTLRLVPVTAPSDPHMRAYTWDDREAFLRRERDRQRPGGASASEAGPDSTATFDLSAGLTSPAFFEAAGEDLTAALAAADGLRAVLDARCGKDSPSLQRITGVMAAIAEWMRSVLASVRPVSVPPPAIASSPAPGGTMDGTPSGGGAPAGTVLGTRAEAYRKLAEAADTLMRLEPHSPAPYLVRRAIAWGGMSLAELMREFIASGYDLRTLYSMLGMDEGTQPQ